VKSCLSLLLILAANSAWSQELTNIQIEELTSPSAMDGWEQYQINYLGGEPGQVTLDTEYPGTGIRLNSLPGRAIQGGTRFLINYRGRPPVFSFNVPGKGNEPRLRKNWYSSAQSEVYIQEGILWPFDPRQKKPESVFSVLTINLHTYQENDALEKLRRVGGLIREAQVDAVFFQEMAQNKDAGWVTSSQGLKEDHMIFTITEGMGYTEPLEGSFIWDWAHYGWGIWEEGIGIFTPGRNLVGRSYWVSESQSKESIDSRMVIKGEILWRGQPLTLASTHLSFSAERDYQLEQLGKLLFGKSPSFWGVTSTWIAAIVRTTESLQKTTPGTIPAVSWESTLMKQKLGPLPTGLTSTTSFGRGIGLLL
jgi:endonuclease/exonuclease/phosphatase family metal-dependent hydrolase